MLQRLIAAVLGVLGLAFLGLGVASATAWRADDALVATASAADLGNGTLVVTAPGVLEMGGGPVTATARASGGDKVVLAVGKEADVAGWVGPDAYSVIAGLTDQHTLRVDAAAPVPTPEATPGSTETPADPAAADPAAADPAAADPAAADPAAADPAAAGADPAAPAAAAPDPDGSDLWVEQSAGETSTTLTWTPQAGRWTLIAAGVGEGAAAPSVELSWPQTVTTPWLVPGVVVGAILLLLAIALAARIWLRSRRPEPDLWHAVETGAIPLYAGSDPTPVPGGRSRAPATSGAPITAGAPAGTDPSGTGPADAGLGASPGDADGAPTIVLTRRQMREAAATTPTPRVSLRRRGARPSDGSPESGRVPTVSGGTPSSADRSAPTATGPDATGPDATGSDATGSDATGPYATGPTAPPASAATPTSRANPAGSAGPIALGAVTDGQVVAHRHQSAAAPAAGHAPAVSGPAAPADGTPVDPSLAASRRGLRGWKRSRTVSPGGAPDAGSGSRPGAVPTPPSSGAAGSAPAGAAGSAPAGPAVPAAGGQWVPGRPPGSGAEPTVSTPPSGSRADAWRRSWGIPDAGASDQPSATNQAESASGEPDEPGQPGPAAPRSGKDV